MSYILEALKKSERDRALGQVPSLGAEQVAGREAPPVTRWAIGALMVLVGLSGGILLTRFEIGDSHRSPVEAGPPAAASAPDARPGAASPAPSQAPAIVAAQPRQPAPPQDAVASRAASPSKQPAAAAPAEQAPTPAAPVPGASANALSSTQHAGPPPAAAAVSAAPPSTPTVSASNVAKAHAAPPPPATPASSGAPEKASTTVASSAPATPEEVPLLRDLPPNVRQGLPALHVDVHVYARNPARRFVLINMRRYREGDTLAAGPRLLRITQGGVVLEYHGVRFRLGSG